MTDLAEKKRRYDYGAALEALLETSPPALRGLAKRAYGRRYAECRSAGMSAYRSSSLAFESACRCAEIRHADAFLALQITEAVREDRIAHPYAFGD